MFHFYDTCRNSFNISFLFSGGITISSAFLGCSSGFKIFPTILFRINSPVASAALWTTFLEAVFRAFSPVFNNCFVLYFLEKFLANDKN